MKKYLSVFVFAVFLFPSVSVASSLTTSQANSIILLLEAFGVDAQIVNSVKLILNPSVAKSTVPQASGEPVIANNQDTVTSSVDSTLIPQFTQYPSFEPTASNQLRVSWRTNMLVDSWLVLCSRDPKATGIVRSSKYDLIETDNWINDCSVQANGKVDNSSPLELGWKNKILTSGYGSISDGQYFAAYIPVQNSGKFYAVEISANGQHTDYSGQVPKL